MAGDMKSILLGVDDLSLDDGDDEMLQEVIAGTVVPADAAVAATVQPVQAPVPGLEREAKARKERFLMFVRVLMKYLEQKDPDMHTRAKAVIRECADKNKNKERGYESVTASMQKRLKDMVGDAYWGRAEAYLNHFLKQKEKLDAKTKQHASSSSSHQQQPQPQT
jgi:hypothetical protein